MKLSKLIRDLQHIQENQWDVEIEEIITEEKFDQVSYNEKFQALDFYFLPF
jgi:hypothetical protein